MAYLLNIIHHNNKYVDIDTDDNLTASDIPDLLYQLEVISKLISYNKKSDVATSLSKDGSLEDDSEIMLDASNLDYPNQKVNWLGQPIAPSQPDIVSIHKDVCSVLPVDEPDPINQLEVDIDEKSLELPSLKLLSELKKEDKANECDNCSQVGSS